MLKTWITGTNDFVDQGLLPSEWINDNVTISNDGKLGKCLYFNGTSSRLSTTNYTLGNKWSWACWVKEDPSVTTWQGIIALNNNGSDNDMQTALWLKANEHRFEVCNNTNYNSTIQYTQGQWNHYAMSFDGTTTKAYLNGNQVATFTSSSILSKTNLTIGARATNVNGGHTGATNYLKGYINDLRIWDDEIISPLQVKQISQGLVLHYPLDNNGWGQENIAKNSDKMYNWGFSSIGQSSNTLTNDNGVAKFTLVKNTSTGQTGNYWTYNRYTDSLSNFVEGETYTLSLFIKSDAQRTIALAGLYESQTRVAICEDNVVTPEWKKFWVTFEWTSTAKMTICVYFQNIEANSTINYWVKNLKLEKGSKVTPWCPNSSDELATTMGMNNGIEYDCSGFGNNGTRVGDFSWTSDTPKYQVSTEFNGTQRIEAPWNPSGTTSFSVAGWFYHTDGTTYYAAKNTYNTYIDLESSRYFVYNTNPGAHVGNWTCTNNVWQHIVLVHDSSITKLKLYINGSFVSEVTTNGTIYNSDILDIGGRQGVAQYSGKMSDFRIYATALSAEDIQKLYSVSALIDSHGNTFASSYVEG